MEDEVGVADTPQSDSGDFWDGPAPLPVPAADAASEIRRLRRWLVVLTVVLTVVVLGACSVAGLAASSFFGLWFPDGEDALAATDQGAGNLQRAVQQLYGSALETVTVVPIRVKWFGDEVFGASSSNNGYCLAYRLKGAPVQIAGIVAVEDEGRLGDLVPVRAELDARLTVTELRGLMDAWVAQSRKPMGAVTRYETYGPDGMESQAATITVAGRSYATSELWRVAEGVRVERGAIYEDDVTESILKDVSVFRLDPKTREFTLVGTEPEQGTYGPSLGD